MSVHVLLQELGRILGSSLTQADDDAVMSELAEIEAEQALSSGVTEAKVAEGAAFDGVVFPVAPTRPVEPATTAARTAAPASAAARVAVPA